MDSRSSGPRLLVGVTLLLGLLAASTTAVGAQEVGSVTIHKVECPAGFEGEDQADLYDNCYFNPVSGQSFSAQQGKSDEAPVVAATDADGLVSLPLYGGSTTLSEGLPQGISEYFVFCSHEDGSAVEFEYTGDTFGIFLEQEGGDYYGDGGHIRCDWYNIPAANGDGGNDGTVSIYRTSCPAGYAGDDYYDDCYDNPAAGIQFSISRAGTDVGAGFSTGPDGYTLGYLPLEAPGTVVIGEYPPFGDPLPYQDYVVFCSKDGGATAVPIDYGQTGVMDIVFDATPDDAIACDWFYVPPANGGDDGGDDADAGSLTIFATACPPGYTGDDYYPDCYDDPAAGLTFSASNMKSDFLVSGTTSGDGFVTLALPAEELAGGLLNFGQSPPVEVAGGADAPFVVYCTTDDGETVVDVSLSLIQLDPGGDAYSASIAYEPGDEFRCDWFLLTAADQDDDDDDGDGSGVIVLPNTGAGTTAGSGGETALLLLTVGSLGVVGMLAERRLLARR